MHRLIIVNNTRRFGHYVYSALNCATGNLAGYPLMTILDMLCLLCEIVSTSLLYHSWAEFLLHYPEDEDTHQVSAKRDSSRVDKPARTASPAPQPSAGRDHPQPNAPAGHLSREPRHA